VLIFIGTATRLSAARREQRFAAIRLVGATPRQVSVISAVESTVAAVAGVAAGFGLFFLLRGPLAAVPFTGAPFFPATFSQRHGRPGRRDRRPARGSSRRAPGAAAGADLPARRDPAGHPARPRAWRLIPLLA
jgi:hypothetical protein